MICDSTTTSRQQYYDHYSKEFLYLSLVRNDYSAAFRSDKKTEE